MYRYLLTVLLLVFSPCLAIPRAVLPYIKGFDLSQRQFPKGDVAEQKFWNCTYNSGFRKVVIRGYWVMLPFDYELAVDS
jgi:hypothetical protein